MSLDCPLPEPSPKKLYVTINKETHEKEAKEFLIDTKEFPEIPPDAYEVLRNQFTTPLPHSKKHSIQIHYSHFKQLKHPVGIVFCFHGYTATTENESIFSMNVLAEQGFEVFAFDQENHGKTCSKEEKFKEDGKIRTSSLVYDYRVYLQNGVRFIDWILHKIRNRIDIQNSPVFLWGQSMGGAEVLASIIGLNMGLFKDDGLKLGEKFLRDRIKGVVVNAPCLLCTNEPTFLIKYPLLALSYLPWFNRCRLGKYLTFYPISNLVWEKNFAPERVLNSDFFSSFEDVGTRQVRLATGRELIRMGRFVLDNKKFLKCPLLLFHGTEDDFVKIEGSDEVFEYLAKKGSEKDVTYVVFKDAPHALNRDLVGKVNHLYTRFWMNQRVGKK